MRVHLLDVTGSARLCNLKNKWDEPAVQEAVCWIKGGQEDPHSPDMCSVQNTPRKACMAVSLAHPVLPMSLLDSKAQRMLAIMAAYDSSPSGSQPELREPSPLDQGSSQNYILAMQHSPVALPGPLPAVNPLLIPSLNNQYYPPMAMATDNSQLLPPLMSLPASSAMLLSFRQDSWNRLA
jgi:hypothetical protein